MPKKPKKPASGPSELRRKRRVVAAVVVAAVLLLVGAIVAVAMLGTPQPFVGGEDCFPSRSFLREFEENPMEVPMEALACGGHIPLYDDKTEPIDCAVSDADIGATLEASAESLRLGTRLRWQTTKFSFHAPSSELHLAALDEKPAERCFEPGSARGRGLAYLRFALRVRTHAGKVELYGRAVGGAFLGEPERCVAYWPYGGRGDRAAADATRRVWEELSETVVAKLSDLCARRDLEDAGADAGGADAGDSAADAGADAARQPRATSGGVMRARIAQTAPLIRDSGTDVTVNTAFDARRDSATDVSGDEAAADVGVRGDAGFDAAECDYEAGRQRFTQLLTRGRVAQHCAGQQGRAVPVQLAARFMCRVSAENIRCRPVQSTVAGVNLSHGRRCIERSIRSRLQHTGTTVPANCDAVEVPIQLEVNP